MHPSFGLAFARHESEPAADTIGVEIALVNEQLLLIRVLTEDSLAEGATRLTPSEQAVVALAVAGRSNGAIAIARGCSPRTIANHLAAAYQKLGLSGRRELRARLRRQKP
jgi:DNA-binding CsgD family transcriptional regulator